MKLIRVTFYSVGKGKSLLQYNIIICGSFAENLLKSSKKITNVNTEIWKRGRSIYDQLAGQDREKFSMEIMFLSKTLT